MNSFLPLVLTLLVVANQLVATASETPDGASFSAAERAYWAFQPITRPSLPAVAHSDLVCTEIDHFVLRSLEEHGLSFSQSASRRDYLRRAKFDLLGLPPTPEEIERFIDDRAPGAYQRLVDRLLADPSYGERWGRYWLDLVRFAETAGFNADPARPLAYKYRDYVIRTFNRDTGYDRFVLEQLAGDELFPENGDSWIATGYNLMWPDESNASNILLARQDALNDLTSSVGSVFLGVSIGCAQCHDHKFDPLRQTDFYRLQAFLVGITPQEQAAIGSRDALISYQRERKQWLAETDAVRSELHEIEKTARAKSARIKRLKFPAIVLEAIDTSPEKRTSFQHQLCFWSERQIVVSEKQLLAELTDERKARRTELQKQLQKLEEEQPRPSVQLTAMVSVETESGPPKTHLLAGGSYGDPLEELQPRVLSILSTVAAQPGIVSPRTGTSGRRSALARWLTDPDNPLPARVMVNRIWQGHFGKGLVENANDLGAQTGPPSHPQLLDWLSSEFIQSGWSIKSLHRKIMLSQVYRQATYRRSLEQKEPRAAEVDQGNQLYWHFPRQRLSAESVRDALLSIAGKLDRRMYGPGVKPELPDKFSSRHGWEVSEDEADRNRRSVYIYAQRNLPYPLLQVFDLPDMHESCARRAQTTVAPQALMLLNSPTVLELAESFARRLWNEDPHSELPQLIDRAYELAFARKPAKEARQLAVQFVREHQLLVRPPVRSRPSNETDGPEEKNRDEKKTSSSKLAPGMDPLLAAALVDVCHALMNANEFIYVD